MKTLRNSTRGCALINNLRSHSLSFATATLFFAAALLAALPLNAMAQQETPPVPAAPRTVALPKPVEQTLKNGLRVIVIERAGVPLISAQVLIENGGEVDPPELSGLANLTADLLTEGTTTRTAPQIAEQIEALGGTIESSARWDAATASVNVMSNKIAPAMTILADIVRRPAFKDEEIERQRTQLLDQLRVSLGQPGAIANFVASRVVFGDTPYGHPLSGTPESLARIKRDDIIKLHSTYYRPDNAILVLGGDIKPADAFKLAEQLFGDWQKPAMSLPANKPTGKEARVKSTPRIVVIDKPDAGQSAVLLVRSGLQRSDQDYYRGIVTNSILNGFSGRLNQEIRIKRGLSYGARSSLDVRRDVGPFIASAQTKNESGAEVASLLMSELTRLSGEAITDAEFTPRKAVLIGNFGRALETTGGLVSQIGALALYGLSLNEINKYINNVQGITASDVQKFAGSRLAASDASIVIVGNAKAFMENLRKQFPNVEVIPVADLDLNTGTLRKAGATQQ
jgi:zinc protease